SLLVYRQPCHRAGSPIEALHDSQLVARIECRCAPAAAPPPLASTRDRPAACGTAIQVPIGTPLGWQERRSNLLDRGTGQLDDAPGDAIVAVVGVSAAIPIDPVAHVDELLGHHDLEGARLLQVD